MFSLKMNKESRKRCKLPKKKKLFNITKYRRKTLIEKGEKIKNYIKKKKKKV